MPSWLVLIIATLTWLAWVPAAVTQKAARGDRSRTSIFPILPLFPLAAWACSAFFHTINVPAGATLVGAGHVALLIAMLCSIAKSRRTLST